MLDLVAAILPLIKFILTAKVPGLNISFVGLATFLFTLQLVGVLLHSVFGDGGGGTGKDSSFTRGRK